MSAYNQPSYYPTVRKVRLLSGVVLWTYLLFHLINHALGALSLDLAERGLTIAKAIWQSWPGTVALYASAAVHVSLALWTLFERRNWMLPPVEWVRLFAGFSLPTLLIEHAVNTRLGASLYGYDPTYKNVVATIVSTGTQGWQFALLAPGWLHGCLGLWITLQRFGWAQRAKPLLAALVVALPLASALGFATMKTALDNDESGGGAGYYAPSGYKGAKMMRELKEWKGSLLQIYMGLVVGAVAAGFVHRRVTRKA